MELAISNNIHVGRSGEEYSFVCGAKNKCHKWDAMTKEGCRHWILFPKSSHYIYICLNFG